MITMGPNPLSWVDDLIDKIVAFQDEVEENICQGPVKYVEDQVKTVGVSVKKFCSNVMKDMEHLAHDEVTREHASLGNQLRKKDSFINKVYSEVKKELSDLVDEVIFENSQSNQLSKKDSFSEVKNELVDLADEDISENFKSNSSRIIVDVDSSYTTTQVKSTTDIVNGPMWFEGDGVNEELSRSDNTFERLPGSHTRQTEQAKINLGEVDDCQGVGFQSETSVPEVVDNIQEVGFQSETSVPEVVDNIQEVGFLSETSVPEVVDNIQEVAFHPETSVPEVLDNIQEVAFQPETSVPEVVDNIQEVGFQPETSVPEVVDNIQEGGFQSETSGPEVVDNIQEVDFQTETSVPEVDQASDSSEAPIQGTTVSSTEHETETGNTTDETVEIYDHQGMIKLGESCVLVDRTEEGSIPNTPRGQQRSYKKKIRDVVLRRWTRNNNTNKHQLYPVVESMEPAGPTTGTGTGGSSRQIAAVVKAQSQTEDIPELEWELI